MKKFLLLFAAISAVVFVSCQKDEDKDKNSLEGTTWTYFEDEDEYTLTENLLFQAGGKVIWSGRYVDEYGVENYSEAGTYTYNAPNVTIQILGERGDIDIYTGTVNENSLFLYEDGDLYGVFQKK